MEKLKTLLNLAYTAIKLRLEQYIKEREQKKYTKRFNLSDLNNEELNQLRNFVKSPVFEVYNRVMHEKINSDAVSMVFASMDNAGKNDYLAIHAFGKRTGYSEFMALPKAAEAELNRRIEEKS